MVHNCKYTGVRIEHFKTDLTPVPCKTIEVLYCPYRAVFLQRRSRELLDNDELQGLWFLLDKHHTPPLVGEEQMINYEDFLQVASEAGPKCK